MSQRRLATVGAAAMPRVLQVPELFDLIVGELDDEDLTIAARVCKQWSEVALSHLWETQTDLRPLFNLLASKGYELKHNKLDLVGLPTERAWHRFFHYSKRVKSLAFDDTDERYVLLLDTFARLRPFHIGENGNLFPSLRSFSWVAPTELSLLHRSVLFMHPGIRTFHITLPTTYTHTVPGSALRQYINHLIGRMPRIESLAVNMKGYLNVVEPFILQLVNGYGKSLKALELPRYWSSGTLLETLATLPKFQSLQSPDYGGGVYDPSRRFRPSIPNSVNSWPALEKLHLAAPFPDIAHFLETNTLPPTLEELYVYTPCLEPRTAVQELCSAIAKRCKSVKYLLLSKCHTRPLDRTLHPTLDDLTLAEFSFHHEFPLVFKDTVVSSIASLLPEILYLDLNPSPDFEAANYSAGDFPSLHSLPTFASSCPELTELGIYLDNDNFNYTRVASCSTASIPESLDSLFTLSIGGPGNVAFNQNEVLMFLSLILHDDCTVQSATEHRSRGVHRSVVGKRAAFWNSVNERLPLLVKVRMEEWERMENLEEALVRAEEEIERCGGDVSVLDDPEEEKVDAEVLDEAGVIAPVREIEVD